MRRYILDSLGDEGVDVELSERQLDTCIRKALQLWTKYNPIRRWVNLGEIGPALTTTYTPTEDEVGIAGVVDVRFMDIDPQTRPYITPSTYELRWGMRGPRLFFELHVAERRMERFTGEAPDWYWEENEGVLYLYNPIRPVKVMALFLKKVTLDDIKEYQRDEFEIACVAEAKYLLARILGKFGSIPGADGEIQTDADRLRDEAREDREAVRRRLERSLRSVPPPRWVG